MSRKVYFTSEQLKHIIGEGDMGGYLDNTSMGSEYPVDSIQATDREVISTEPGGETRTADSYAKQKIANNMWTRRGAGYSLYENRKKVVKNDKGEIVPETCPECGSKIGVYIKGEPVYLCSNKKCGKYFGTVPFPKSLQKEMDDMEKDNTKNKDKIDENCKGALFGAAIGAASLFGNPQQINAQTAQMHQGNDTIGYNIRYANGEQKQVMRNDFTPDEWAYHKKYYNKQLNKKMLTAQELRKLCPAAYKDRNNPKVWEKNKNEYVFNNPDGRMNVKGMIAASHGQNPWEAIVNGENTVEPIIKETNTKINKHLNERNAELDGKKIYSLPNEVRRFATPDGVHDDIMKRLRSGEQMDLPSLYRLRNELSDSSNTKITNTLDLLIKRAQMQGNALRNVHSDTHTGMENPKSAIPGKGHRKDGNTKIYYENN